MPLILGALVAAVGGLTMWGGLSGYMPAMLAAIFNPALLGTSAAANKPHQSDAAKAASDLFSGNFGAAALYGAAAQAQTPASPLYAFEQVGKILAKDFHL